MFDLIAGMGLLGIWLVLILVGIGDLILSIWGAISVIVGGKSVENKILWILVLAFIPLGGFIWLFWGRE